MLTLLNNWKVILLAFALITSLALNAKLHITNLKQENKLVICQGDLAAMNVAFQAADQESKNQERMLRLREQEAARARAESRKRMDDIMGMNVPDGCDNAIKFGIERAQTLQFHWQNNIP